MRALAVLFTIIICFAPAPTLAAEPAVAQNSPNAILWQEPNPDNLVLLEVYLDRYNMGEVITSYYQNDKYFIPLGALSQIVGIAVSTNTETGTAEGFVLEENRHFWLDVKTNQATISGTTYTYNPEDVVVYPDDIYVSAEQLSSWFPFDLDIDTNLSILLVKTLEKFPYQLKLERKQKIERYNQRYVPPVTNYPEQEIPYSQYSVPFIDQSLSFSMLNTPTLGNSVSVTSITYLTADLANHQADMYLAASTTAGLSDFRLTFSRKDPDGGLLGGVNATEYAFAYVTYNGYEHTSVSHNSIIGGSFSNFPLTQQLEYDSHTFRGRLLPGWEVELYHNGNLVGFVSESSTTTQDIDVNKRYFDNGEYVFENIPLIFGQNNFVLVFYGPHGEHVEEKQNFVLSSSMVRMGESYYRATTGFDESTGQVYMQGQYDVGIRKNVTITSRVESLPYNNQQHTYYSVGSATFFKSMYMKLAVTGDSAGGNLYDIHMQTRVMFMNIGMHYAGMNNFVSEIYTNAGDPIVSRTEMRIDTSIAKSSLPRIPLVFEYKQDTFTSGAYTREISNRMSLNRQGMSLVNEVFYVTDNTGATDFTGQFQVSRYKNGQGLRGEIYYTVQPQFDVTSLVINYFGKYVGEYRTSFAISNTAANDMQYVIGATKSRGEYSFTGQFSYTTNGEFSISATMSMNMAQDPRTTQWVKHATPVANKGSLSIVVFYDANQNGVRDEGEEGLPNVGFTFDGARRAYRTDSSGSAFITGLPVYKKMAISIDLATLEDPLWLPSVEGYSIVLRPGATGMIELPVNTTGEMDGVIYLQRNGKQIPLSGVDVQLVDKDGQVLQTVKTAYDGYYVISRIPVGEYTVRIAPEQLQKNGINNVPDRRITVTVDNLFISGVDFVLRRS